MSRSWRTVRVAAKTREADDITSFALVDPQGASLQAFSAGSHIDVKITAGLIRQYSLCNDPRERHRYLIGVLREPASRGGSATLIDLVEAGAELQISEPHNHFALDARTERALLLAGGIGITPIRAWPSGLRISARLSSCITALAASAGPPSTTG